MLKTVILVFATLMFAAMVPNATASASEDQTKRQTATKPSSGNIEVLLPERWKTKRAEEKPTFWWTDFTDFDRVAEPFIFWGKNFGKRDPSLEDWGNAFIKRLLVRVADGRPYTIEHTEKRPSVLGSGQEVEFVAHRIRINKQIIMDLAFAFLASKDGSQRVFIGVFQAGTFGDVWGTIPIIAQGIFFKD